MVKHAVGYLERRERVLLCGPGGAREIELEEAPGVGA